MKKVLLAIIAILIAIVLMGCPTIETPQVVQDTTTNLLDIPGVTVPVTGATPITTITETAQYSGTVRWNPTVSSTFAASKVYTATITLTAKAGFSLTGVTANSFKIAGATTTNSAGSGVITAVFSATNEIVNITDIPGITAPVLGATPVTTITETAQYTGTVSWSPAVSDTFAASTAYTATITLTSKSGYTLTDVAANSFKVIGATTTNSTGSGVITAVFSATNEIVNITEISGVTAPVLGATPVTTITETAQYTGTVSWSPAVIGTFAASTVYTATITLTSKSGYTLTDVAANSFKVLGATTTNSSGSGVITAVFPATEEIVNITDIPGVTAPVLGATPVTTITETAQYTGTIEWNGSPVIFAASTTYTATINLTVKAGFSLTGVTANGFKVAGSSTTNSAGSGIVTAEFPPTLSFSLTMKNVPAGKFQRDATATNISVITQSYKMSANEITRAQFKAIMTTDPSDTIYSSGTSDPVQKVNWYHAIAFCNKLSFAEGLTPVYAVTNINFSTLAYADIPTTPNTTWDAATASLTNNGYRLPTEMEWMWAAMGAPVDGQSGGTNTTGYLKGYAGSTEGAGQTNIGSYAWYYTNSSSKTQPSGTRTANELGLYDMSGNVWEWCWDWYAASYHTGTQSNYMGAASSTNRSARGGSWDFNAAGCTAAYRLSYFPYGQYHSIGFRVVRN